MRSVRKYGFVVLLLAVAAASWYIYAEYNRKPSDLSSLKPQAKVNDSVLITLYMSNEQIANQKYLGKPIDVTGTVLEIINLNDTVANIMLGKADELHKVSCLMDAKHVNDVKDYIPGNKITIRGICTGFLIDVELNRCVIIK